MRSLTDLILRIGVWLVAAAVCLTFGLNRASAEMTPTKGQTVYLSAYPKIERQKKETFVDMVHIVSIRNTDRTHPVTVDCITYHDSKGDPKRELLKQPLPLGPLASHAFRLNAAELESEAMTGCFLIRWQSSAPVSAPLAEIVIAYSGSGFSYSFVFTGVVVEDAGR